ncbi:MAG: non-homologous end-joining DNA ligase [Terriglobia bacterium]
MIPDSVQEAELTLGGRKVRLTNLSKPFWPELGIAKRDLLQYYADVSQALLPHLAARAMVMKRYPHGAYGEFFFMKRTPDPHPEWLQTCSIRHASANVIAFPVVDDLAALLWVVNLGCIDLNQWYARCDDVNRPDYLHFDLDPVVPAEGKPTPWKAVLQTACALREALDALKMPSYPKTTGSRGLHIYVPIERGPLQKQVWTFAKQFAKEMEAKYPKLITAEYRIAKRPAGRVLVDYNQNAWGRTLASVYSVRPKPKAMVSAPVTWDEVTKGFRLADFHLRNMPARVRKLGDLYEPLLAAKGRVKLEEFLK